MKRPSRYSATIAATVLAAAICCSGCYDKAGTQGGTVARKKPTPEESFQLIFETFRRGIETGANGVSGGFVSTDASRRTRLTVDNTVSQELIPPTTADEPFRAKITVVSRSAYSLTRNEVEEVEGEGEEAKVGEQENSTELGTTEPTAEVNILDPELISVPKVNPGERDEDFNDPVSRRADEEKRTYELVYQDGRWRLLTKLDEETEKAVQSAFEKALRTQT